MMSDSPANYLSVKELNETSSPITDFIKALLDNNSTTSTSSPGTDESSNEHILQFQFWTWAVLGNIIAILGLIGNILSIIVLANKRMMSSTSVYLIGLAVCDCIVLIALVLCMALPLFYMVTKTCPLFYTIYLYINPYAYPIALTAQTFSIYITVAFTAERYIAVSRPLRAAKYCTIKRSRNVLIIVGLCSVIYNIPRMLEMENVWVKDPETNMSSMSFQLTELGRNPTFQHIYFIYMHIFVMLIIPFLTLAIFNVLLIRAVRASAVTQGKISNRQKRENGLTIMLIAVIVVFLLCQVPSIVDNTLVAILGREDPRVMSAPFVKLTTISGLMVIFNSAINFYLYCVFGEKFRRVFCATVFICFRSRQAWLSNMESFRASTRGGTIRRYGNKRESLRSPNVSTRTPKTLTAKFENGQTKMDYIPINNGEYEDNGLLNTTL